MITNFVVGSDIICWEGVSLNAYDVYRLYVAGFALLLCPFAFFNVQKTMFIQLITTVLRWVSLATMIVVAIIKITGPSGGEGHPKPAVVEGIPQLFGSAVYSLMCHHSLPSLVTPIKQKRRITALLAGDFLVVLTFYLLLTITGVFAFGQVDALYTLNFRPGQVAASFIPVPLQYFISLFPVFTISASFPIIAITLRNNIHAFILALISFTRKKQHHNRNPDSALLIGSSGNYGSGVNF